MTEIKLLTADVDGVFNNLKHFKRHTQPERGGDGRINRMSDGTLGGSVEYWRQIPTDSPRRAEPGRRVNDAGELETYERDLPAYDPAAPKHEHQSMDPETIAELQRIVDATDCKILVCSTWRLGRSITELQRVFELEGLRTTPTGGGEVIGLTPHCYDYRRRGYEVAWWLAQTEREKDSGFSRYFRADYWSPFRVTHNVCLDDDRDYTFNVGHATHEGEPLPTLGRAHGLQLDVWNTLVKCHYEIGLTRELADECIRRLTTNEAPTAPYPADLVDSYAMTIEERGNMD